MTLKRKLKTYKILRFFTALLLLFVVINTSAHAVLAAGKNYVTLSDTIENIEPFNMLIGGTDLGGDRTYESNGVRTDVLMLVSYNPENIRNNQALSIISIPRDTNVYIPCANLNSKINAAASYGILYNEDESISDEEAATSCTIDTVEYLFDTTIDYYLFANFDTVIDLVDAVEGIDVYNSYEFCEQDEYGNADAFCFDEGNIHLDGQQALAYARQRHYSSDYERTQRQQIVVAKLATKIITNTDAYALDFAKILAEETQNNIDYQFIIQMINYASKLYNQYLINISNGQELNIDVKNSPYTMDTEFDIQQALNTKSSYTTYDLTSIYTPYSDYEVYSTVNRYSLTDYALGLAHSSNTETETTESNTLELEFISLYVHESIGTSDSYPDDNATAYVSEIMNFEN